MWREAEICYVIEANGSANCSYGKKLKEWLDLLIVINSSPPTPHLGCPQKRLQNHSAFVAIFLYSVCGIAFISIKAFWGLLHFVFMVSERVAQGENRAVTRTL